MDCAQSQRGEDSILCEYRLIDSTVVGKHGDGNLPSCSIARRVGELRATLNKVLGLRLGAVIDREVVPGREQIGGYGASHAAQPDEADLHHFMPPSPL